MEMYGYAPCTHKPGLWRHKWQLISFALVVSNFGVKYTGKEHAQHWASAYCGTAMTHRWWIYQ
eukprot:8712813-Ditylum_brightwellii.AAC.1